MSAAPAPAGFEYLNAADAADVEAISAQILPGGATPGAREAHAVYFIDRALATFLSRLAGEFRAGLTQFQAAFRDQAASGIHEGAHGRMISVVSDFRAELFEQVAASADAVAIEPSSQYTCEI